VYNNVNDAAKAIVDVLESDYKYCYVVITGPKTMNVKEKLEMITEILNYEIEIEFQLGEISVCYLITPY